MSAPEPVAWMVDYGPNVEDRFQVCTHDAIKHQLPQWAEKRKAIPLYAGPMTEEWEYMYLDPSDSEVGARYVTAKPEAVEKLDAVAFTRRRLVGPWEEVPRG